MLGCEVRLRRIDGARESWCLQIDCEMLMQEGRCRDDGKEQELVDGAGLRDAISTFQYCGSLQCGRGRQVACDRWRGTM